jgi:hypothetical protein
MEIFPTCLAPAAKEPFTGKRIELHLEAERYDGKIVQMPAEQ